MTNNKVTSSSENSSIPSNQEINDLIENNLKLVGLISKRFPTNVVERQDLIGAGYIGLIKAAHSFNAEKGYKFSTYAGVAITNEMKKLLGVALKNKETESIQEVLYCYKNNNSTTLEETLISPIDLEEDYLKKEEYFELHNAIKKLDEEEQEWIYLYYGFYGRRYTGTEISKMYGMYQSTFSRRFRKVTQKLKEILKESDFEVKTKTKKLYK